VAIAKKVQKYSDKHQYSLILQFTITKTWFKNSSKTMRNTVKNYFQ